MNKLENQEKDPHIKKLHDILSNFPKEKKLTEEWQVLENELFIQMYEQEKNNSLIKKIFSFPQVFLHFLTSNKKFQIIGAYTFILLFVGIGTFISYNKYSTQPLANSRIVGVSGTVQITNFSTKTPNNVTILSKNQISNQKILRNQIIDTKDNASIIVQVDEGSSFILSEKTKLTIKQANSKNIELFLHKGNILASISKRKKSQIFKIVTPEASCKVIGTVFRVSVTPHNNTNITNLTVLEGKVEISDNKNPKYFGFAKTGESVCMENRLLSKPRNISKDSIPYYEMSLLDLAIEMNKNNIKSNGVFCITSDPPKAKIHVKGKYVGETPLAIDYPSGDYSIKIEKEGFNFWEEQIELQKLHSVYVSAKLIENTKSTEEVSKSLNKNVEKIIQKKRKSTNKYLKTAKSKKETVNKIKKEETKDFGFILNPSFVEALMHMTIGEYQKALIILDSLKELPTISITEKIRIVSKISACYKGLGNFEHTLKKLIEKYNNTEIEHEKSNYLWEIITVKANCLEDYAGAETDIIKYIKNYPDGTWIESAYTKLGEIQYITGKYTKAVGTFQYHINFFKTGSEVENSIYTIANIMRIDIKEYKMAIKWYTRLLNEYKYSNYYGNALFERAVCYEKLNMYKNSRNDYKKYLELYPKGHLNTLCSTRLSKSENSDK